jgi:hypothetical protein
MSELVKAMDSILMVITHLPFVYQNHTRELAMSVMPTRGAEQPPSLTDRWQFDLAIRYAGGAILEVGSPEAGHA